MSTSQKIVWGVSVVIICSIALFVWRFMQQPISIATIDDSREFLSQKDFVFDGQPILSGGGFEPGWNFKLNISGQKFALELISQYGDSKYVGYLDLLSQSTTTKLWGGFVLDKNNTKQPIGIKVDTLKCTEPSGDEVDYTTKVMIGSQGNIIEELDGCAEIAI